MTDININDINKLNSEKPKKEVIFVVEEDSIVK
jgi:hypothetical protein